MEPHSERFSPNQSKRSSQSSTINTGNHHQYSTDIICCPCGDDDDSGFTIQCEQCLTWQHGKCMNISPVRVPRYHICDSCHASPRNLYLRPGEGQARYDHSTQKLLQHQKQQRNQPQHQQLFTSDDNGKPSRRILDSPPNIAKDNEKKKSRDISINASTSIIDSKRNDRHSYDSDNDMDDDKNTKNGSSLAKNFSAKQEPAPGTSQFIKHDTSLSTSSNKKQLVKRKGSLDASKSGNILMKRLKTKPIYGKNHHENDINNNNDDDDGDDDETVTPYDYSANKTMDAPPKTRRNSNGTRTSRLSDGFVQVYRNIIKDKLVKQIMKEAREEWKSSNNEFSTAVPLDASVLLPSIPKVSVRPLWKSLLGNSTFSTRGKNDPSVRKGVFAEIHVPENRFLMEINGEISIKSAYKCDLGSLYPILHTPEDHLFFYPSLDLMIDARSYGNDSRYVRRSCHPNAQIKCITLASHGKDDDNNNNNNNNKDDDQTVHLGLFTLEDVEKGEELSVAWDWQRGTSLWKTYTQWKRQQKNPTQQSTTVMMTTLADSQVKHMLDSFDREFGGCACEDKDECFVAYMKDVYHSFSTDNGNNVNKKGIQRRRRQQVDPPGGKETRSNETGQRRRSKDYSQQQQQQQQTAQFTQMVTSKQDIANEPLKATGKIKRHRSSKSSTSMDLTAINMNAKNDLFFASLPTSRATSPVHNVKSLPTSTTEKHESALAARPARPAIMTTTTVADVSCDTVNLKKKWMTSSKLPCKKAWMKTYLAEMNKTRVAPEKSPSSTPMANAIDEFWNEADIKLDRDIEDGNKIPYLDAKRQPGSIIEATDNDTTTSAMDDLVMDESIGDDSSTATLPLDNSNEMVLLGDRYDTSYSGHDKNKSITAPATSVPSSKGDHHTATILATDIHSPTTTTTSNYSVIKMPPSQTDNHNMDLSTITPSIHPSASSTPKPIKAKLSLQEYLSMRKKA